MLCLRTSKTKWSPGFPLDFEATWVGASILSVSLNSLSCGLRGRFLLLDFTVWNSSKSAEDASLSTTTWNYYTSNKCYECCNDITFNRNGEKTIQLGIIATSTCKPAKAGHCTNSKIKCTPFWKMKVHDEERLDRSMYCKIYRATQHLDSYILLTS